MKPMTASEVMVGMQEANKRWAVLSEMLIDRIMGPIFERSIWYMLMWERRN